MKRIFLLSAGIFLLLLFCGCQTAAEKKMAKLTLPKGHPLPHLVSAGTFEEMEKFFRSSNLSPDMRTDSGIPILILAVASGNENKVRFLLAKGADREAADLNGCRALHAASSCGNEKIVSMLLKSGADINAPGSHGRTPLMESVRTSRKKVTRLLLGKGAALNSRDERGRTPLMHGASAAGDDPAIVKMLLEKGADKKLADKEGWTALMYAAHHGNAKSALVLLKDMPDFTGERAPLGLLIMKCAIDGKNPELVKALIRKKVPLNWDRSFAHDSLRRIKMHGLYRILVRKGVFDKRRSPLMWAALNNDKELVELLLSSGADPLQKDENGNSAYDLATKREVISILKKAEKKRIKELQDYKGKPLFRSKMFQ